MINDLSLQLPTAMAWYPFQYNSVLSFKNSEKIDLGTSSDEAAKHFDALVTGMVMGEEDPSYEGKDKSAFEAILAADPNWVTPKLISSVFASLGKYVHNVLHANYFSNAHRTKNVNTKGC